MLNAMPDKFLISTRVQDAKAPKSIYSNKHMDTFFGCNMVKFDQSSLKGKKSSVFKKLKRSQKDLMLSEPKAFRK